MRSRSSSIVIPSLVLAGLLAIGDGEASAQAPGGGSPAAAQARPEPVAGVATPTGHAFSLGAGRYTYVEPGALRISIHGAKVVGEYTGTLSLHRRTHWFAQGHVRGSAGSVKYDGWCMPWVITPDSSSPNGYALGLGSASACSEGGDADGYVEGRVLVGKDFFPAKWGVSPASGLGVRYLSNGTTGAAGYRTDAYLYVPLGVTARIIASRRVVSLNAEYDVLLRGWQTTRQSKLGGGGGPATPTTPAFTVDRFSDLSFPQHRGWAVRAGATYQLTPRWSVEPSYVHWNVGASPVRSTLATFTVNGITAGQPLRFYEPVNVTDEWSVRLGFRF